MKHMIVVAIVAALGLSSRNSFAADAPKPEAPAAKKITHHHHIHQAVLAIKK